jgi:trk system potassium uptake protein TrkA
MHIIVAGAGDIGAQLAQMLTASGNDVVVIDNDRTRASTLTRRGLAVVFGDACRSEVIESAGGLRTDVLVACTASDEENLVISVLAKRHLDIPRVVARVNVDSNRWLFDHTWGVDAAVSAVSGLVSLIEEATGSAESLHLADLAAGGLTLVEVNLTAESTALGKTPDELTLGETDVVAVVIRSGQAIPVDGNLRLAQGDSVLVVTHPDQEGDVRAAFYPGH